MLGTLLFWPLLFVTRITSHNHKHSYWVTVARALFPLSRSLWHRWQQAGIFIQIFATNEMLKSRRPKSSSNSRNQTKQHRMSNDSFLEPVAKSEKSKKCDFWGWGGKRENENQPVFPLQNRWKSNRRKSNFTRELILHRFRIIHKLIFWLSSPLPPLLRATFNCICCEKIPLLSQRDETFFDVVLAFGCFAGNPPIHWNIYANRTIANIFVGYISADFFILSSANYTKKSKSQLSEAIRRHEINIQPKFSCRTIRSHRFGVPFRCSPFVYHLYPKSLTTGRC